MEEGTEADLPGREFGLAVGEPVEFRFLNATARRADSVGTTVDEWENEGLEELAPVETILDAPGQEGTVIPVRLRVKLTEVGTLELWCVSRDGKQQWRLEFATREGGPGDGRLAGPRAI
jgi:hypothetical protein